MWPIRNSRQNSFSVPIRYWPGYIGTGRLTEDLTNDYDGVNAAYIVERRVVQNTVLFGMEQFGSSAQPSVGLSFEV